LYTLLVYRTKKYRPENTLKMKVKQSTYSLI
jgi:hypothetical protein